MTESELKKHLDAAEKSPQEIAAAVSGLPEETLRYKPSPDKCGIRCESRSGWIGRRGDGREEEPIRDSFNDKAGAKFALSVGALGNVTTETLKAFTEAEHRKIVGGLS